MYSAGTLNVSKNICAAISLLLRGFSGASVNNTGCCEWVSEAAVEDDQLTYLFTQSPQFFSIYPTPYPLHVIPIGDNAVFHGVFDL
jgi:hypothetical protein